MRYKNSNIGKCLATKTIARCTAFFLFCLLPLKGLCQTGESTVNTLVDMGFENVGWTENDGERVYVLQNSAYRSQGVGISKAVDVIQEMGLPEKKACRIIVLDNNIPQISLYYHPIKGDTIAKAERKDWNVSYDLGETVKDVRKIKVKNSSLFKIDVLVYPQLAFKNLVITQIYQVLFDLSPAIEVSLWKGMKLTGQLKIPVYNDGYGSFEDKVHPGHLTISQRFRLPYNIFGKVTAGYFNANQYGIDAEFSRPFKDERFAAFLRLGYTGTGYWDSFKLHYDPTMTFTWAVGGSFFWPRYNTQFIVQAQKFLYEEKGIKAEMIRHFRYCSIGFYAMKAEGAKANGGFRFQVLLPPYKYKRHKYVPRINTSANMGIIYNAGNERYYYKEYKAETSDNIMEDNSFNPYFIKSELLNF
ncbi:hypothetical protein [uncultured Bacteroides sp.]|uniref:hypothetical protein n=1 Tax=uncultured Bacteroides sp. TaxID=162156 RepID=UPI0025E0B9AA|nr:hypothetical protein [uncultured Bacteroides sp.]